MRQQTSELVDEAQQIQKQQSAFIVLGPQDKKEMNLDDNDSEISLPDVAHQIMRNNNSNDDPIFDIMRIAPQGRHDQDMALENEMRDFEAAMDFAGAVSNRNGDYDDDSIDTTATLSDDNDDDHMEIRVSSGSPRQSFEPSDKSNAEKVVEIPSVIMRRLDGGGRLNESRLQFAQLLPAVSHAGRGGNVDSGNTLDHGDGQRSPDSLT